MNPRTFAIAALFGTCLLVAGCLSSTDPGSGNDEPGSGDLDDRGVSVTLAWDLQGCRAAAAFFDVPAARVEPYLPEGFEPVSMPQAFVGPDAPNPTGDASFGLEMLACDSGASLDGLVEPMAYGSVFVPVLPPGDLRDPEADFTFMKLVTVVPDAPRRDLLAERGVTVVDGDATWASFDTTGSVVRFSGALSLDDAATHRFDGVVGPSLAYEGKLVEWSPAGDGLVRWQTRMSNELTGLGRVTVDVAEGTLAAEVLGPGPAEGIASAGIWNYVGGTIEFVERS